MNAVADEVDGYPLVGRDGFDAVDRAHPRFGNRWHREHVVKMRRVPIAGINRPLRLIPHCHGVGDEDAHAAFDEALDHRNDARHFRVDRHRCHRPSGLQQIVQEGDIARQRQPARTGQREERSFKVEARNRHLIN